MGIDLFLRPTIKAFLNYRINYLILEGFIPFMESSDKFHLYAEI